MDVKKLLGLFLLGAVLAGGALAASHGTDIGFKGIGGHVGFVDPEWYGSTVTLGAVADLGTFVPQLHWDASLSWWSSSYDYWPGYSATLSDIVLRSGVKYHFIQGEWEPYAGGGLGLHFYSTSVETPHGGTYYAYHGSDDTDFGFYLVGGVAHPFTNQLTGTGEVQLDFEDVDLFTIQFGLIYQLGR
jgi:hypothetical protein